MSLLCALPKPASAEEQQPVVVDAVPAVAPSATADQGLPPGTEGILTDVERIVDSFERSGWFVDEQVYDETEPVLLESVCRATEEARRAALAIVEGRRLGDPRALYERAGSKLTDGVEEALMRHREYTLLKRSLDRAAQDCPFWITPGPGFEGRQTVRNKWAVHVEGGGIGQMRVQRGEPVVGAGGNGRLLLGRGFGNSFSLLAGAELGGGALLKSSDSGQFAIQYLPATPVVFRYRRVAWFYELELAPVALFEPGDTRLSYGGRVGAGIGLSVLRIQSFLPWAGVAASYDHFFPGGGRPATEFVRIGARVGFRWLP